MSSLEVATHSPIRAPRRLPNPPTHPHPTPCMTGKPTCSPGQAPQHPDTPSVPSSDCVLCKNSKVHQTDSRAVSPEKRTPLPITGWGAFQMWCQVFPILSCHKKAGKAKIWSCENSGLGVVQKQTPYGVVQPSIIQEDRNDSSGLKHSLWI